MITRPTVFVLGAGASQPYGYPTGKELFRLLIDLNAENTFINYLMHAFPILFPSTHHAKREYDSFIGRLKASGLLSIDSFFSDVKFRNSGGASELISVGKFAVAYILNGVYRKNEYCDAQQGDWYRYLYNGFLLKGISSLEQLLDNNVSFVTFNYDLSLERFFENAIRAGFGVQNPEAFKKVFSVLHIHGKTSDVLSSHGTDSNQSKAKLILEESKGIKFVDETTEDQEVLERARRVLESAERVFFLGFGYLEDNMKKLNINWENFFNETSQTQYFGTCYGLEGSEEAKLLSDLKAFSRQGLKRISLRNCDCLAMLKEYAAIL